MVHPFVLATFLSVIVSVLVGYGEYSYAFLCIVVFMPTLVLGIFFHAKRPVILAVLILFTAAIANLYILNKIQVTDQLYVSGFAHEDSTFAEISGRIISFPGYRFSNNQYIAQSGDSSVHILAFTEPYQKFSYLESVSFVTELTDIRTQGEEWSKYYRKLGVQYVVFRTDIRTTGPARTESVSESIKLKLFELKQKIRTQITERFPSHTSALILGMLLGEKDELSKSEKDMFNYVGLSHILVVSGYNISLLISFIFIVFSFVHKYLRTSFSLLFIVLFVMMVGSDGSVVRAALMGSIIIFAKLSRRPSSAINVLFIAATCMLLYNPFSIYDAGLHLSCIATFSLLVMPKTTRIPEFIMTTAWVFVFVAPYIAFLSGFFSIAGIVSNVLVVLLLPAFMLLSLVTLGSFMLSIPLFVDVFILDVLSRYVFIVAYTTQQIPRIQTTMPPDVTVASYVLLFGLIVFANNRYSVDEFIEKRYQRFVPRRSS